MENVYIIIPAWNEAKRIGQVLNDLSAYNYRVVVVDDGSTDQTFTIASQYPKVTVLHHLTNRGQGAALATGTAYALSQQAEIVVHFDADGQMLSSEIKRLIEPLIKDSSLDLVLGSKFLQDNIIPWFKRYFLLQPALLLQRLSTGLPLTDVHNGFRALRANTARVIKINQEGMAHASEIVSQIKRLGLHYQEVPVTVVYHEFGQGMSGGFKIIRDLIIRKIVK